MFISLVSRSHYSHVFTVFSRHFRCSIYTSLTSTCLSTCSSSFRNCFARQLSVRYVSCNARLLSRALPPLHGCEPSGLNELLARSRADPRVLRTLLHVLRVVLVVSCSLSFGFQAAVPPNLRVVLSSRSCPRSVRVATCFVVCGHLLLDADMS